MAAKSTRRKTRHQVLVGIIGTVCLVGSIGLATLIQGNVHGREFSPSNFQLRNFSFWEIPLVHLQVRPIRRSGSMNSLASYLIAQKLIQSPQNGKQLGDWHLVKLSRGTLQRPPSDAEILVQYLEGDLGTNWRDWTVSHPKEGAILWPVVQNLAQRELYVLLPELFRLAKKSEDPNQLQASIRTFLIRENLQIASDLNEAGRSGIARELLAETLLEYPDSQPLQEAIAALPPPPPAAATNAQP